MKLIVIGQGGREQAIATKLAKDKRVEKIFMIPGSSININPKVERVKINTQDFETLVKFAKSNNVYLTIVGPELELSKGIVDVFQENDLKIFGPNRYCAQMESSKSFAKTKMDKFNIPTAAHQTFFEIVKAKEYIDMQGLPIVLKADGLAAGKGVFIVKNVEDVDKYLKQAFHLSPSVVIEEFLEGEEFSLLAFVTNKTISYMQIAQDYKKAFDGDEGENTGGMGAYTPVRHLTEAQVEEGKEIIRKLIFGLADEGTSYTGVIYAGCMATKDGVKTIEFNARFGDPETEVILPAMEDELIDVIEDVMNEKEHEITWSDKSFVGVVIASNGYPGDYEKGIEFPHISGNYFPMGLKYAHYKKQLSTGGRVAFVYEGGKDLKEARELVYKRLSKQKFKGFFYRKDIALNK